MKVADYKPRIQYVRYPSGLEAIILPCGMLIRDEGDVEFHRANKTQETTLMELAAKLKNEIEVENWN